MKRYLLLILVSACVQLLVHAQDYPLLPDHPGTFKLINFGVYTHYDCGFTKAETTVNYQKITKITDIVRKDPVFINQKGFNCEAYVYAKDCPDKFGYGIPSSILFGFGDWFMDKGQAKFYKIEPPSWTITINQIGGFVGGNYGLDASKPSETSKPGFNFEKWKSTNGKLKECFYLAGEKEQLGDGIDRYNSEVIVIYNPDRPPYYLPVKFRELAELKIEYWKLHPNKIQSDMILPMLEAEYAQFSEAERDGWAYNNTSDPRCSLLGITTIAGQQPVVRLNPEYWNKKLSRSNIQFLTFSRLTDTDRYSKQSAEWLKSNSVGYSLNRFLEALDIKTLIQAIDK
jgi:hypothetical protein